jgi:hypothetical protein
MKFNYRKKLTLLLKIALIIFAIVVLLYGLALVYNNNILINPGCDRVF